MITDHQKHLAIGATVLVAGGFLIWYLLRPATATPVSTNAAETAPDAGAANPGSLPGYMNYNVPPYAPPNNVGIQAPTADSCCRDCAGGSNGVDNSLGNWSAFGGSSQGFAFG